MAKIKAGVLGATGAVGQRFIEGLKNHPWFELTSLAASERSAGKKYKEAAKWRLESELPDDIAEMTVVNVDPREVDADIVFSALPSDDAKTVEPAFAAAGMAVASNTSSYRMVEDVPLLIPECNYEHLDLIKVQREKRGWDGYLTTNPNCTTVMFTLPLKPLMKFGIKSVHVASMQAVSGAGYEGVPSMAILGNVIPYIGGEEEKVETEPQKILGRFDGRRIVNAEFSVSASCHRVPVMDGHTEAVWVTMRDNPTPEEVKRPCKVSMLAWEICLPRPKRRSSSRKRWTGLNPGSTVAVATAWRYPWEGSGRESGSSAWVTTPYAARLEPAFSMQNCW